MAALTIAGAIACVLSTIVAKTIDPPFPLAARADSHIPPVAQSKSSNDLVKEARARQRNGDLEQAEEAFLQALELTREEFGQEHEYVGYLLSDIGLFYKQKGDYGLAVQYAQDAIEVVRMAVGQSHPNFILVLNNLAWIRMQLGNNLEAAADFRNAKEICDRILDPMNSIRLLVIKNFVTTLLQLGELTEANEILSDLGDMLRRNNLINKIDYAEVLFLEADLYRIQENYDAAYPKAMLARDLLSKYRMESPQPFFDVLLLLALIAKERSQLGIATEYVEEAETFLRSEIDLDTISPARIADVKGSIFQQRGMYLEAEELFREALAEFHRHLGTHHSSIARTFHNLAICYQELGDYELALEYYQRAIEIYEETLGGNSFEVAIELIQRGHLLSQAGKAHSAIEDADRARHILESIGKDRNVQIGYSFSVRGWAFHALGRLDDAASSWLTALDLIRNVQGPWSLNLVPGLLDTSEIYLKMRDYAKARNQLREALAIQMKAWVESGYNFARTYGMLSTVELKTADVATALNYAREGVSMLRERAAKLKGSRSSFLDKLGSGPRSVYEAYLEAAAVAIESPTYRDEALVEEMFEIAQYPSITGTTNAIRQMSVRFGQQDSALGDLIRRRQDILEQWRANERLLIDELVELAIENSTDGQSELRTNMENYSIELDQVEAAIAQKFPKFEELTDPQPISLQQVRSQLGPQEALWLQVTTEIDTHLFLVRQSGIEFSRSNLTRVELTESVQSLREGLDIQGLRYRGDLKPFDTRTAYRLYQSLFGSFKTSLEDVTHLIIVADGAMQNLPPTVMMTSYVSEPPAKFSDFTNLREKFLGHRYAFSVMPSVSSFVFLRSIANTSVAPEPFVGIGNPVLEGGGGVGRGSIEALKNWVVEITPDLLRKLFAPLPNTETELRALAQTLNAPIDSLLLDINASESRVKQLKLDQYRIVAFATHGLLAGEFKGLAEPALILTPPEIPSREDDGLLTASEIAEFQMDADWVILSACNTGGPEGEPGAEGLSGLAKSFFYAGSRALLVSHWVVVSASTENLTAWTLDALRKNPEIGRAEALRRAMTRLMVGEGNPDYAHPLYWAPFVIVGEGGASF